MKHNKILQFGIVVTLLLLNFNCTTENEIYETESASIKSELSSKNTPYEIILNDCVGDTTVIYIKYDFEYFLLPNGSTLTIPMEMQEIIKTNYFNHLSQYVGICEIEDSISCPNVAKFTVNKADYLNYLLLDINLFQTAGTGNNAVDDFPGEIDPNGAECF